MNPKKILIVSATFYPLNTPRSNRTTELVKELARQGHTVTLITPKEEAYHIPFEVEHQVTIKDLGKRKWKGISFKSKGIAGLFERAIFRLFNLLFEYPDIELYGMVKKALKNEKGYDLMISIAVPFPVHWGVAGARQPKHEIASIWVADCGDPYMFCKTDSFRKLFYFKYVEKWFCRKADYLTVPTDGSIDAYYPEFKHKIKVIPQGFNFEDTPVFDGVVNNPVPLFGYAGGFIPGIRDPREFLAFLVSVPLPYKFIIYTTNNQLVKPFELNASERVETRTYIPRKELIYELSKMDFLVNFTNGTSVQTPSKLIDYAIIGRPILNIDTGNLNTSWVNEFLQGNYKNQLTMENTARYNIKTVVSQFIELAAK